MAVRLYPPIMLRRQAVWTFWSGLRSDLGGPFSVSLMAQTLDLYVIVGRTTAVYSRRGLWKHSDLRNMRPLGTEGGLESIRGCLKSRE